MTEGGGGSGGRRWGGGGGRGGDGEGSPPAAPAVLASKEHGSGHADPQDRKAHGPPFGSPCCQARLGSDKPFRSPFGSPGWMGEMAPAGWMRAHPYPLPPFFPPSLSHHNHLPGVHSEVFQNCRRLELHHQEPPLQQSKYLFSHGYT